MVIYYIAYFTYFAEGTELSNRTDIQIYNRSGNVVGIEGKRGKGRPRVQWMDNIKEWMNLNYCDCVRLANNREEWSP